MRWPPVSRLDPFCSYMPLFFHPSIHDHLSLPVVVRHRPHGRLEVGRGLLLDLVGERVDLEAVEARHELVGRPLGPVLGVHHEQHVREPRPEVRAVRVVVSVKQAQV